MGVSESEFGPSNWKDPALEAARGGNSQRVCVGMQSECDLKVHQFRCYEGQSWRRHMRQFASRASARTMKFVAQAGDDAFLKCLMKDGLGRPDSAPPVFKVRCGYRREEEVRQSVAAKHCGCRDKPTWVSSCFSPR